MQQVVELGRLHMGTLDYFRRVEDGQVRGDPDEGLAVQLQPEGARAYINGMPVTLGGPFKLYHHHTVACHVFCMAGLSSGRRREDGSFLIGADLLKMNECAVIINPKPFFDRLIEVADGHGMPLSCGWVRYVQRDHDGEMNAFTKFVEYRWQCEYRIVTKPTGQDFFDLELGPLDGIAELHDVAAIRAGSLSEAPC